MADGRDEQHLINGDAEKIMRVRRLSLVIDVLLIGGCAYLLVGDLINALGGQPEYAFRGGAFLVNLSATFALVYRSMALTQRFWPAPPAGKGVSVLKGLFALVLPLLVASLIELSVHGGHRAQLDALVEDISARTARAIAAHAQVRAADLDGLHGPYLQQLTMRTDTGAFVLSARVPGFDTDGYAARYSSTEGRWHLQPLASPSSVLPASGGNGPVLICRPDRTSLNCERRQP